MPGSGLHRMMLHNVHREMRVSTSGENPSFPTSGQNDLFDMTGLIPTPSGRPQDTSNVEATNA
jgi:hypothetical protein